MNSGSSAHRYHYSALKADEIRLIELLPGSPDQDIWLSIHVIPLEIGLEGSRTRKTPHRRIARTLPTGWESLSTPEGRLFYYSESHGISYEHPNPDQAADLDLQQYQGRRSGNTSKDFEALSYAWGDGSTSC